MIYTPAKYKSSPLVKLVNMTYNKVCGTCLSAVVYGVSVTGASPEEGPNLPLGCRNAFSLLSLQINYISVFFI